MALKTSVVSYDCMKSSTATYLSAVAPAGALQQAAYKLSDSSSIAARLTITGIGILVKYDASAAFSTSTEAFAEGSAGTATWRSL